MKLFKGYDWILIAVSLIFLLYVAANDLINLLSEKTSDIGISFSNGIILGLVLLILSCLTLTNKVTGNLGASVLSYGLLGYFLFLTCTGNEFHPVHNKYQALFLLAFVAYSLIFKAGTYSISLGISIFWVYLIASFHEGNIKTLFDPSEETLRLNPNCMLVVILCLTVAIAIEHYKRAESRKDKRFKENKGRNNNTGANNSNNSGTIHINRHYYNNQGNHNNHHHDHYKTTEFNGTPVEDWNLNFGPINDNSCYDHHYD